MSCNVEASSRWRVIQRVSIGVTERNEGGSGGRNPLEKRRAHRKTRVAHAGTSHYAYLMAASDQARRFRHDEGDVASALKHREEDSG